MCQTKTVLVPLSLNLLVAAGFSIYQTLTESKVVHHSEIKSQGPCENEYKKNCLNGGECYYLFGKDNVGCDFTWLKGAKRCQKKYGGMTLEFEAKNEKLLIQNLTRGNFFKLKSDTL